MKSFTNIGLSLSKQNLERNERFSPHLSDQFESSRTFFFVSCSDMYRSSVPTTQQNLPPRVCQLIPDKITSISFWVEFQSLKLICITITKTTSQMN